MRTYYGHYHGRGQNADRVFGAVGVAEGLNACAALPEAGITHG